MKHEQLVNAAKELNEVLLPDPEINVHATPPVLKKQVIEYAGMLAPGDNLTENTVSVLKELGVTIPGINAMEKDVQEEPTISPESEDAQEVSLEEFVIESNDFKELKNLVKEYNEFKSLRGILSKFQTVPVLKQAMLKELGVEDIQQTEDVPESEKKEKPKKEKKGSTKNTSTTKQVDVIRNLLKKNLTHENVIKELAKELQKKETWAIARIKVYEKKYGEMGKNDKNLK